MSEPELLLRGGTVIDGTGAPARRADVLARGGRIVAVGENLTAEHRLDCGGLAGAPRFLDPPPHPGPQLFGGPPLPPKVGEGGPPGPFGPDGDHPAPLPPRPFP